MSTTTTPSLDPDGALLLAAAIAKQWLREHPHEVSAVARWLGMDPAAIQRRMEPVQGQPGDGWRTCAGCGATLPPQEAGGRRRKWCSERCRHRSGVKE